MNNEIEKAKRLFSNACDEAGRNAEMTQAERQYFLEGLLHLAEEIGKIAYEVELIADKLKVHQ